MATIRPLTLQDAAAVYAAVDSSRSEFAKWMMWYQPSYAPEDAAEWVRRSCAQHEAQSDYHFAICVVGMASPLRSAVGASLLFSSGSSICSMNFWCIAIP